MYFAIIYRNNMDKTCYAVTVDASSLAAAHAYREQIALAGHAVLHAMGAALPAAIVKTIGDMDGLRTAVSGDVVPLLVRSGRIDVDAIYQAAVTIANRTAKNALQRGGNETQERIAAHLRGLSAAVTAANQERRSVADVMRRYLNGGDADVADYIGTAVLALQDGCTVKDYQTGAVIRRRRGVTTGGDIIEAVSAAYDALNIYTGALRTNRAVEARTEYIADINGLLVSWRDVVSAVLGGTWEGRLSDDDSRRLGTVIHDAVQQCTGLQRRIINMLGQGLSVAQIARGMRCKLDDVQIVWRLYRSGMYAERIAELRGLDCWQVLGIIAAKQRGAEDGEIAWGLDRDEKRIREHIQRARAVITEHVCKYAPDFVDVCNAAGTAIDAAAVKADADAIAKHDNGAEERRTATGKAQHDADTAQRMKRSRARKAFWTLAEQYHLLTWEQRGDGSGAVIKDKMRHKAETAGFSAAMTDAAIAALDYMPMTYAADEETVIRGDVRSAPAKPHTARSLADIAAAERDAIPAKDWETLVTGFRRMGWEV